MTVDVFIAYTQQDKEWMERLRNQLSAAERIGLVDAWHDEEIAVGDNRIEAAREAMEGAEIIVLLMSADFFASEYLYEKEMKHAIQLANLKGTKLLPVLLRECTWQLTPLANYQILPKNKKAITDNSWQNPDQAIKQVVDEIIQIATAMRKGEEPPTGDPVESKPVTTSEKQKEKKDTSTPLWRIALYAILGLGAFALLSATIDFLFANPEADPPSEVVKDERAQEGKASSEVLTRAESTSMGASPFATVDLGGLEWAAANISIPADGAIDFETEAQNVRFGKLYPLEQARKICPEGWRLPTRAEWEAVTISEMKSLKLSKAGAYNKAYFRTGEIGYYLSSDHTAGDQVWVAEFRGEDQALRLDRRYAHWGMSCRCVR